MMEPTAAQPATEPARRSRLAAFFRRNAAQLALFVVALVGIHLWQTRGLPSGPLPEMSLTTLDGREVKLGGATERPLVLHFWATWCGVCRAEEGNVAGLAQRADVLTVATQSGPARRVEAYLLERDVDFPVVVDEDGELARRFGVDKFPTTFFVRPSGSIASVEVGYTNAWGMRLRHWWSSW